MADDDLLTERLLRVVDEGRRTATYKLALLLALIDSAALAPGADVVGTHDVAELVLEHYYPQARRYLGGDGVERDLQQISMKTSSVWSTMLKLRILGDNAHCRGVSEVRSRLVEEYANAVDVIEDTFVRYPIPLLQVVGNRVVPFLYEVGWPEGTSVATLRRQGRDQVRFLAGVTDRLVVLGPLLRPLIELHWTRDVARWTRLSTEDDRLHAHLFGSDRVAFPPDVRAGLSALQDGACFYCGSPLTSTAQVDHFLAWSRFPNDAIENLVLADRCNGDKSDHLAAPMHLDRWVDRCLARERDLRGLADETRWRSDSTRSRALVRSTYGHVAPGTPLWVGGKDFVEAEGPVFMRG